MNFRKNKLDIFTNFYYEKRKAKTGVDCQQTNFGDTVWNFYNTNTGNDYLKNCDNDIKILFITIYKSKKTIINTIIINKFCFKYFELQIIFTPK